MDKFKDEHLRAIKARDSQKTGVSFGRKSRFTFRPVLVAALIVCLFTAGAFAAYRISLSNEVIDLPENDERGIFISRPFGFSDVMGSEFKKEHAGIDFPAETGTPVLAAADGTVTGAGFTAGYGNYVIIDHEEGCSTVYAHMEDILTEVGETVKKGDQIGTVGSTGRSTGPHLHFELRIDGEPVDPSEYWEE